MENTTELEELKTEVKNAIIENKGEKEYYKIIGDKINHLIQLKSQGSMLFPEISKEEQKIEFKKAVMESVVEKYEDDEDEMLFQVGILEIAFDAFDF